MNDLAEGALAVAMASLWGTAHNTRVLAERGMATVGDVDQVHASILEAIETQAPEALQAQIIPAIDRLFDGIRAVAAEVQRRL